MPQTFHYEAIATDGAVYKRSTKVEGRRYTCAVISKGVWPAWSTLPPSEWTKAEFSTKRRAPLPIAGNIRHSEVVPANLVKVTGKP